MSWQEVGLWRMLTDWLHDPQRRKQLAWRCVETWGGGTGILAFAGYLWLTGRGRVAIWLAAYWLTLPLYEWLLYEFVLEPLRLAGPYWERTAAAGSTFTRW